MALTSSSTLDDALAQYNDNLSWDGDTAKAILALEAVRWLLANRPVRVSEGGVYVDYDALKPERDKLEAFVSTVGQDYANGGNRCTFTRGKLLRG